MLRGIPKTPSRPLRRSGCAYVRACRAEVIRVKVEFYYSGKQAPGPQFPCDNAKALELCKQLVKKGVTVKTQDCGEQPAGFFDESSNLGNA